MRLPEQHLRLARLVRFWLTLLNYQRLFPQAISRSLPAGELHPT
jgi:hypothetical protein